MEQRTKNEKEKLELEYYYERVLGTDHQQLLTLQE